MRYTNNILTMSREDIQRLIEKYYRGETTLEEDALLFNCLRSDTSSDFQSEKAQFLFFEIAREDKPGRLLFDKAEADTKENVHFRFGFTLRIAAVLVIAFGLAYSIFIFVRSPLIEISTEANAKQEIKLPDGSHVWLHSSSQLRYPRKFDKDNREVFLDGEAYFEIVKDPAKPFIVHAHETTTKVVGTSFDLRNYGKEEQVELTVFTGKVI